MKQAYSQETVSLARQVEKAGLVLFRGNTICLLAPLKLTN